MKKTISIVNQKGGVGKTTVTINLAGGLAINHNKKILIVDTDPQSDTTLHLGVDPLELEYSIVNIFESKRVGNSFDTERAIIKTKLSNIHLLPSTLDLDDTEQNILNVMYRETILKNALKQIKDNYDFIIIDCRPAIQSLTLNAIEASDFFIVPIKLDRYSVNGLGKIIKTVQDMKGNNGPSYDDFYILEEYLRILKNDVDVRETVVPGYVQKDLEEVEDFILETSIHRSSDYKKTQYSEAPILHHTVETRSAEDFTKLSEEILKICQKQ